MSKPESIERSGPIDGSSGVQCEGWRRYGGAFSFGPPQWRQCENAATMVLTVTQKDVTQDVPACNECWGEACATDGIKIVEAKPIT